jgi:CelD/BcsL family acetyltransferase involved in cellulose biosynthesis
VSDDWTSLWQRSERPSIFMSPQWMATWLEVFGSQLQPTLFQVYDEQGPVTCFALVSTSERQRGLPVRRLYLNASGEGQAHDTCLEYNDLLCRKGAEDLAVSAVLSQMSRCRWDEFILSGAAETPAIRALTRQCAPAPDRTTTKPAHYVNLDELRQRGVGYDATLSPNTRTQLRRSRSLYERNGAVITEVASDLATASDYLNELIAMHQRRWRSLGEPGAFNSTPFTEFHRRLINRLWDGGAVHLLRVRAGAETIGLLYNFIVNGCVAFYQSGFAYADDNRLKPGLVTHTAAIHHYLASGYAEYDLLAGVSRYKQSLAKNTRELHWMVHERRGAKMAMYRWLRVARQGALKVRRRVAVGNAARTLAAPKEADSGAR